MSKRYVIQVCTTDVPGFEKVWENVQHPAGGDWMTRSKTRALNDAVTLVTKGETRPLRIGISKPVYAVTVLPELDVAEAVALSKEVADPSFESDDVFADEGMVFELVEDDPMNGDNN